MDGLDLIYLNSEECKMFLPVGKGVFPPPFLNLLHLETSIVSPKKSIVLVIPAVNGLKNIGILGSKCFMLTKFLMNTGMFYWLFEKDKSKIFLT